METAYNLRFLLAYFHGENTMMLNLTFRYIIMFNFGNSFRQELMEPVLKKSNCSARLHIETL